jgi:hypothetical protein
VTRVTSLHMVTASANPLAVAIMRRKSHDY